MRLQQPERRGRASAVQCDAMRVAGGRVEIGWGGRSTARAGSGLGHQNGLFHTCAISIHLHLHPSSLSIFAIPIHPHHWQHQPAGLFRLVLSVAHVLSLETRTAPTRRRTTNKNQPSSPTGSSNRHGGTLGNTAQYQSEVFEPHCRRWPGRARAGERGEGGWLIYLQLRYIRTHRHNRHPMATVADLENPQLHNGMGVGFGHRNIAIVAVLQYRMPAVRRRSLRSDNALQRPPSSPTVLLRESRRGGCAGRQRAEADDEQQRIPPRQAGRQAETASPSERPLHRASLHLSLAASPQKQPGRDETRQGRRRGRADRGRLCNLHLIFRLQRLGPPPQQAKNPAPASTYPPTAAQDGRLAIPLYE